MVLLAYFKGMATPRIAPTTPKGASRAFSFNHLDVAAGAGGGSVVASRHLGKDSFAISFRKAVQIFEEEFAIYQDERLALGEGKRLLRELPRGYNIAHGKIVGCHYPEQLSD